VLYFFGKKKISFLWGGPGGRSIARTSGEGLADFRTAYFLALIFGCVFGVVLGWILGAFGFQKSIKNG